MEALSAMVGGWLTPLDAERVADERRLPYRLLSCVRRLRRLLDVPKDVALAVCDEEGEMEVGAQGR